MKRAVLFLFCLMSTPCYAQQTDNNVALLSKVLNQTRVDRNQLLDALTESQARNAILTDDLAKAQMRIKALEAKNPDEKEKDGN